MSNTFTPITILLIEDNPAFEGIKAMDLKARGVNINSLENNINVPGINFKKEENKDLHNLFALKVLQHPEEIKEYISNCLEKEDKEGSFALGSIAGIVPEIVEFDYKLYDNLVINSEEGENQGNIRIKYWSSFKELRKYYNPNFLFGSEQHLEKKENENYNLKDFIERINKKGDTSGNEDWYKSDETQLKEDDLGLYAGVEIARLFRNHPCIGIPATFNKKDMDKLHAFSKFYEWMNEYDLGTMFSREKKGNKDWDSVIAAAVKQLRIRIETLLKSNKITLKLSQLKEYADGKIRTEQNKRIFTFQSAYGVRHLPLDGLFIDVTENRNDAIKKWVKTLLKLYKVDAYKTAKDVSETLIKAHKGTTIINNRIRLSELVVKLANIEFLTPNEQRDLTDLQTEFGINNTQIGNAIKDKSVDIENKVKDYRDLKTNDNQTNRLIVLFTDLQLHFARQKFCEMNYKSKDENGIISLLGSEPNLDDLRAALYPIPKNPLILPYHYHLLTNKKVFKKKEPFDAWEKPIGRDMNGDAIYSRSEYPKNLSDGEIQLCKSFCLDLGLTEDYYPKWLLKNKSK